MVNAKDVAKLAGTSTAVVSYVFNDGPRGVAPATRERVLEAARKLDYRPNALARSLSAGKTRSIGLVVPNIANPFFAEIAFELEEAADAQDQLLVIGDSALDPRRERRLIESFLDRRVDSLVLASTEAVPDLGPLQKAKIPVIALHPVPPSLGASSLTIDYERAAYLAASYLAQQGHRSVGILSHLGRVTGADDHHRGFARAAEEHGLRVSMREAGPRRSDAFAVAAQWLQADQRPSALYAESDEQAFGVLAAAHAMGVAIPSELVVVSVDGTQAGEFSVPPLTSVRQPTRRIAERAIELLTTDGALDSPVHETFDFELVIRESGGALSVRTA